jgi:hypothetical protein
MMQICGSHKLIWLISISLCMAVCIGLVVVARAPLYGQANRIPDLRGLWNGYVGGCIFQDAYEGYPSGSPPDPNCDAWDDTKLNITEQNGSVFAGLGEGPGDKFTGIILADGTVSIQGFDPSNHERILGEGTVSVRGGSYLMTGYMHIFRDPNKLPGAASMGTVYLQFSMQR